MLNFGKDLEVDNQSCNSVRFVNDSSESQLKSTKKLAALSRKSSNARMTPKISNHKHSGFNCLSCKVVKKAPSQRMDNLSPMVSSNDFYRIDEEESSVSGMSDPEVIELDLN